MALTITDLRTNYRGLLDETLAVLDVLREDRKIGGDKYVDLLALAIQSGMTSSTQFTLEAYLQDKRAEQITCEIAKCNYELTNMLPKELEKLTSDISLTNKRVEQITCEINKCEYELANILPKELEKITSDISLTSKRIDQITCEISKCEYELANVLPKELEKITADVALTQCQVTKCTYEVENMLPTQRQEILMDISLKCSQKSEIDYRVANVLPKEVEKITADINYLVAEEQFLEVKKSEMIADGLKDRESKGIVDILHQAQTDLYGRQKVSFDDKRQTDIVSKLLDVWTIEATNTIEANTGIALVSKPQVENKSSLEVILNKYVGTDTALAVIPPTVTLVGDNPQNIALNDPYTELGATAVSGTGADLTSSIVIGGDTVDTSVASTYHVTYTVEDNDGLSDTVTRDVIVS